MSLLMLWRERRVTDPGFVTVKVNQCDTRENVWMTLAYFLRVRVRCTEKKSSHLAEIRPDPYQ